ncbi:MAG TPA: hypothetical protein VE934_11985 [Polaromonas sp.]|nr:hypothetical protein [Polaromonas sp.]HYW57675.1 hypothetical protein [Polaromonas sp.]
MLLSRGVQPSEIEDMSLDRLTFWLEICEVIAEAQQQANPPAGH